MTRRTLSVLVVVGLVVTGLALGGSLGASPPAQQGAGPTPDTTAETGDKLATIISVTDGEVRIELEQASFERALESDNETERAQAIADRASALIDRAEEIAGDVRATTTAYEAGNVTMDDFARDLAILNAEANGVLQAFAQLEAYAADVSPIELQAAGYNETVTESIESELRSVTGAGFDALFNQFTGDASGSFAIETDGGIELAVEQEDGERSREYEREQPGNGSILVDPGTALQTAESTLSTDYGGTWVLTELELDRDDGAYAFSFALRNASAAGEAEVSVDATTGEVFAFEEELEPGEGEETDTLGFTVVAGTMEPGTNVTLRVTADGAPVAGANVSLDDRTVGETNDAGEIVVELPASGEAEFEATHADREGELELELGGDESNQLERIGEGLDVAGTVANESITVTVSFDGDGVPGMRGYVDETLVDVTGSNGTLTFTANVTDGLEMTLQKGFLTVELEFEQVDGSLELVEIDVDDDRGNDDDRPGEGPPDDVPPGDDHPGEGPPDDVPPGDDDRPDDGDADEGDEDEDDDSDEEEDEEDEDEDDDDDADE